MLGRHILLITLILLAPVAARPLSHEDVWLFRRLGAPKVSPNGDWAVLSVSEPAYDKDKKVSDLWLVPTDGRRPPRRLTSTPGSEGGVEWSQQSDRIVFTAKRGKDKHRQVYIMDMTQPGEALRASSHPLPCSNPMFTPDGKSVIFESQVYPGATDPESQQRAKKEAEDRKENVSSYEGFPIRYWDHWLDHRHPRPYLLKIGESKARDLLAQTDFVKEPGFAGVSGLSGESLQCTLSPDGKELLFVATRNRDKAVLADTLYQLYSVRLQGGPARVLSDKSGSALSPRFAKNGKLYTLHSPHNDFVYNLEELKEWSWPIKDGGKLLTKNFDRSVDEFMLMNDGSIVVSAAEHGRKRLFRKTGSKWKALDPKSRGVFSGMDVAGRQLVGRYEDGSTPSELVKVSLNGEVSRLSQFNKQRAQGIDWRPFKEFWFTSSKGRKIHNWMVLPPALLRRRSIHWFSSFTEVPTAARWTRATFVGVLNSWLPVDM